MSSLRQFAAETMQEMPMRLVQTQPAQSAAQKPPICSKVCHQQLHLAWWREGHNFPAASGRAGQDAPTQAIACSRLPLAIGWKAAGEEGQHHPQNALHYYLGYLVHWCNPSASQHCDQTLLWATIKYFTIKRKEIRLYFCNFQSLCKNLIKSNCFNPTDAELKLSPNNT